MRPLFLAFLTHIATVATCPHNQTGNQNVKPKTEFQLRKRRLAGGYRVDVEAIPYIASVQVNNQHKCGASILSEILILTAAHCIIRNWYTELSVKVGSSDFETALSRNVAKVAYHREFIGSQGKTLKNDVAVLVLDKPLEFGRMIKPIELFEKHEKVSDERGKVNVYGWGDAEFEQNFVAEEFKYADLHIVSKDDCERMIQDSFDLSDKFCAISPDGKSCPCFGDSGGPLVIANRQAGITTGSIQCDPFFPTVFTDITVHRDWIEMSKAELSRENRPPVINHPLDPLDLAFNRKQQSESVNEGEAPFVVAVLSKNNDFLCSGSIIGEFLVLTAASCANSKAHTIRSDSIYWNSGGLTHTVTEIFTHPQYKRADTSAGPVNDVALVRVRDSFGCAESGQLLLPCMPKSIVKTDEAIIYGWGSVDGTPVARDSRLRKQVVNPISGDLCKSIWTSQGRAPSKGQVCARHDFGMCTGDLGSPLMSRGSQSGIFSWGASECADYRFPSVYSYVKAYEAWIKKIGATDGRDERTFVISTRATLDVCETPSI